MKTRLNLTIDNAVMDGIKAYAASKNTSVSELVESYFKNLQRPVKRKTIIELVDKLPKPKIEIQSDLKKEFYESQSGKYGF